MREIRKELKSAGRWSRTRLCVGERVADDAKDFGGRRLLLQRLGEIVGALAQLVEQTRVLDGDGRLSGKIADDFDLLLIEWPHFLAVNID